MRQSPRVAVAADSHPARFAFLMAAGAVALTLAGCAVAGPVAGPAGSSDTGVGPSTATAGHPAGTASASAALSPKQRAQADATAILADFAVPPGAKQLSAPPASVSHGLAQPYQEPGDPALVDKHSLWEVTGAPAAALSWEEQHAPRQFTHNETFEVFGFANGVTGTGAVFSLPAITDVLDSRALMVEVVAAGGGQTAIRVDAQVTWVPPKPAGAVVPSAATVVTLSMNTYGGSKPPTPVTITDPATVGELVALIDHVPPEPGGTYSCPPGTEVTLDLIFRARPGGPALATAALPFSGCEFVELTVGKQDYILGHPGGAPSIATQVLKAAGVHWTLPPSD